MSIDWNETQPDLQPPFNTWPRWAIELDMEIADIAGDVGVREEENTPEGRTELAAYDRVRKIIKDLVTQKRLSIIRV